MKSIRLSLMFYFLALLAVALGTASLLAYRSAQQALEKKKESAEALVRAQYKERHDQQIARLDEALLKNRYVDRAA